MAPKKRVMWASRHVPTPEQVTELQRLFGMIEIKPYTALHDDGNDIALRMKDWFCDELVLVARPEMYCAMSKKGILPLRPVGFYDTTKGPLIDKEACFKFLGFQRVHRAELQIGNISLPLKYKLSSLVFCGTRVRYEEHIAWLRKKFGDSVKITTESNPTRIPDLALNKNATVIAVPATMPLWTIAQLRHNLPLCTFLIGKLDSPRSRKPLVTDSRGTFYSFVGFGQIEKAQWISEKL